MLQTFSARRRTGNTIPQSACGSQLPLHKGASGKGQGTMSLAGAGRSPQKTPHKSKPKVCALTALQSGGDSRNPFPRLDGKRAKQSLSLPAAASSLCTKEPGEKQLRIPFTQGASEKRFRNPLSFTRGASERAGPERIIRPSLYREPSRHAFFAHGAFGVRPFLKTGVYLSSFTGLILIKCKQMFAFLEKVGRKSWTNGKDVR